MGIWLNFSKVGSFNDMFRLELTSESNLATLTMKMVMMMILTVAIDCSVRPDASLENLVKNHLNKRFTRR